MDYRKKRSRCDWAGNPIVTNSPAKPPPSPTFTHLYSSLLFFHIMPPNLSSLLLLSLDLPLSLPHRLPASPSVSFCVSYYPALLHLQCCAALTIRTSRTYTRAHMRRHTPTTSGSPPPFLTPLHCRHETTTPDVPVLHQQALLEQYQISTLHSHT